LYDAFKNLISCYHPAEGPPLETGWPILDLIQADWGVFSERLVERGGAGELLEAIMRSGRDDDDGQPPFSAAADYVRTRWCHLSLADLWQEFVDEVMRDPNRPLTFRGTEFDEFLIREDLVGRRSVALRAGTVLYRARLGFVGHAEGPKPFAGRAIGPPPADKVRPGRANAERKIVLYCADQQDTAVAEVRPALGEYVSVAQAQVRKHLEILDLVSDPDPPNPFTDETVRYWIEFAELLSAFAQQLAKPIRSRDDLRDYVPSQKLAEAIEKTRVAGIRYPSAMNPGGTNVVLFDPAVAEIGASRLVEIVAARVEYREV
jgi:RES domain-containing protein